MTQLCMHIVLHWVGFVTCNIHQPISDRVFPRRILKGCRFLAWRCTWWRHWWQYVVCCLQYCEGGMFPSRSSDLVFYWRNRWTPVSKQRLSQQNQRTVTRLQCAVYKYSLYVYVYANQRWLNLILTITVRITDVFISDLVVVGWIPMHIHVNCLEAFTKNQRHWCNSSINKLNAIEDMKSLSKQKSIRPICQKLLVR